MSPETCDFHAQYDLEIKQLIRDSAELRSDVRSMTSAVGRVEAAMQELRREIESIRKDQSNQRVEDAKQSGKLNFLWTFFVEKNGLIIIFVLAYMLLGKSW